MHKSDHPTQKATDTAISLSPQQATLACLYVLAACDGAPAAAELNLIDRLAETATCLADMAAAETAASLALARDLADAPDGLETLLDLCTQALDAPHNGRIAYAQAVEFVACHGQVSPEEMHLLDLIAERLAVDRLSRAAIETAARWRQETFI